MQLESDDFEAVLKARTLRIMNHIPVENAKLRVFNLEELYQFVQQLKPYQQKVPQISNFIRNVESDFAQKKPIQEYARTQGLMTSVKKIFKATGDGLEMMRSINPEDGAVI